MKRNLLFLLCLALLAVAFCCSAESATTPTIDATLKIHVDPQLIPDESGMAKTVCDVVDLASLDLHAQQNMILAGIGLDNESIADVSLEVEGDTVCINSNLLGDYTLTAPLEALVELAKQNVNVSISAPTSTPDLSDVTYENTVAAIMPLAGALQTEEVDNWEIDSDKPDMLYTIELSSENVKAVLAALQQDLQSSSWLANNTFDVNGEKVNGLGVVDIAVNGIGSVLPAGDTPAAVAAIGVSQSMGPVYIHLTVNGESKTEEKVSPASLEFVLASKTEATKTFNGSLYVTSEGNDSQLCTLYGELLSEGFHGEVEYATIQADGTETPHGAFSMDLAAAQNALDAYFSLFSAAEKENGEYSYEPAGHLHAGFSTGDAVNLVAEFAKSSEDAALVAITAAVTPSEEIASRVTDNRVELLSMTEEQQQTIVQTAMVNAMGLLPTVMQHLPEEAASLLGQLISQ